MEPEPEPELYGTGGAYYDDEPYTVHPCQIVAEGRGNKICENEPFPNPYNKNTSSDVTQATRQNYWTYNKLTGKCEEFKGEGYWCQDDKTGYNLFLSEEECRMDCMLEDGMNSTALEKVLWRTHNRADKCYEQVKLPKESCKAINRWTVSKEGRCQEYEAMGAKFDSLFNEINQFEFHQDCEFFCPYCENFSPSSETTLPTYSTTEGVQEEKEEEDGTDYLI